MTHRPGLGQFSWALFDWANSAFITFVFATYFSQGIAVDSETGTAQWGWALTASGIAIALLSPVPHASRWATSWNTQSRSSGLGGLSDLRPWDS